MRRYTEKIKVVPDEVRKRLVPTSRCTLSLFDVRTKCKSFACRTADEAFRLVYSRTVPSAWRGWSCRRAMKASCSTKASSQSWWASLASVGTCTICCAWWPCTTMAIRWVKACEPDVVMMSLQAQIINLRCLTVTVRADDQASASVWTDGDLIVSPDLSKRCKRCIQLGLSA